MDISVIRFSLDFFAFIKIENHLSALNNISTLGNRQNFVENRKWVFIQDNYLGKVQIRPLKPILQNRSGLPSC